MIFKTSYASSKNGLSYDEIFSLENLIVAYQIARRGKRGKHDVVCFETNICNKIASLYTQLKNRNYEIKNYKKFVIFEPKERQIQALSFSDRVVLHTLCDNFVVPEFEKRLIYDNCACRKNKGSLFGLNRISHFLKQHYAKHKNAGYVLKCDITKYFQSIDHSVLKNLLDWVKDADIKNFLFKIIDSYEYSPNVGLPMGNQTSQWFALLYLNPLDRLIKEKFKIKHYIRYMDDCIIIDKSKQKLKELLVFMRELVEDKLKLKFNNKTQIFTLKNGFEFLGFRFYLSKTGKVVKRVKNQTKKRFIKRLKIYEKQCKLNKQNVQIFKDSITACIAHLKHGNSYYLVKNNMQKMFFSIKNFQDNK